MNSVISILRKLLQFSIGFTPNGIKWGRLGSADFIYTLRYEMSMKLQCKICVRFCVVLHDPWYQLKYMNYNC